MKIPRSCGFLIVQGDPIESFLLMKHPKRWDLPKGHVDPGESDMECALRELVEETGISEDALELDPDFRFEEQYEVKYRRDGNKPVLKTLVIFLARLVRETEIVVTEHDSYEWFKWSPPHEIQAKTINPVLNAVERHLGDA